MPGRRPGAVGPTPARAPTAAAQSEELSAEQEAEQALALEEAQDVPFTIEIPEPLPFSELTATYGVPLELLSSALRFPPLPPQAAESAGDRNRTAADAMVEAYAAAARDARQKHDSLVADSNASTAVLRNELSMAVPRAIAMFMQASAEIDAAHDAKRAAVEEAFAAAKLAVDAGASAARLTAIRTAGGGRARLNDRYRKAPDEIDKIVSEIAAPFGKTFDDATTEIENRGAAVDRALTGYKSEYLTLYPLSGSAVTIAENEAVQALAAEYVPHAIKTVADGVKEAKQQYATAKTETVNGVKRDSRPPLDRHRENIRTEGISAINKTMGQALKQIEKQTAEAQKGLREMRINALRELGALRRASRSRLLTSAKNLLEGLRTETDSAIKGIQQATRSSLVVYERTVSRLGDTARKAAEQGPDQVQAVARTVGTDIQRSLASARRQQGEQITANGRRAIESLSRKEANSTEEKTREVADTLQRIGESADRNIQFMRNAVEQHSAAFAVASTAIASTSESWARPFSVVFPKYAAESVEANKKPHEDWAKNVNKNKTAFLDNLAPYLDPHTKFSPQFVAKQKEIFKKVSKAATDVKSELTAVFNTTESRVTGSLHNLTKRMGDAVVELFGSVTISPNPEPMGLYAALRFVLWDDDYNACVNYLAGDRVAGARYELRASIHWYNDEEARIEQVMRDLTPEERTHLGDTEMGREVVADVRDSLGGTDLNVFDALKAGNDMRADAYRLKDRMDETRQANDLDAFNAELARSFPSASAGQDRATADERRQRMQRELAAILDGVAADQPAAEMSQEEAERKVLDYALRDVEGTTYDEEGNPRPTTFRVEGAQRDLATALIQHGNGSVPARIARLGVEFQRPGKPNINNLDETLIDRRLNPHFAGEYSPQEIEAAARERTEVFQGFANRYLPTDREAATRAAQARTDEAFRGRFGTDHLSADLTSAWIREPHPSPRTAALAMRVAKEGSGTNEELMNRTAERMTRPEIQQMVASYREQTVDAENPNGRDFHADMGVFGHRDRWFTELSGDEALKFEVKLLGIPQNAREEAEVAALEAQQQMEETGFLGRLFASGGPQEQDLLNNYAALQRATGGTVTFGADGTPHWTGGLFDSSGNYTGDRPRELSRTIELTRLASQAYAERIDSYANAATMGIAIIGAIVAAAVTVATGGGASPLLLAAIAGITGLAAIGVHKAISGGRYGWEEMMLDLGMTAVQALTAGVGQSLSLASRGGAAAVQAGIKTGIAAQAGKLTGHAFTDMLLIGAATGGLNALGQTALQEMTWSKGLDFAIDELLAGLARGVLSGAATAAVSNAFDEIKIPRMPRTTVASLMGQSTNPVLRGGLKAVTNGLGGFAGRGVELGFEKGRGRYRGDAGDIFVSAVEAAAQNAGQSFGEGAAEAKAHAGFMRRQQQRLQQAEAQGAGTPRGAGEEQVDPLRLPGTTPPSDVEIPPPPKPPAPGEPGAVPTVRPVTGAAELAQRAAVPVAGPEVEGVPRRPPSAEETAGRLPPAPEAEGPQGPRPPGGQEIDIEDPLRFLTTGPLVQAPAEGLALRWPAAQGGYWGVDPATGMTVQEYRFLASRGLPPRDATGRPLLGPNANVMTRMRIHSPDPTAPPGSASRTGWTLNIEQGNLRMRADGGWFDTRYSRAPDGTEVDVRPYRRAPDGAWVESASGRPVTDANVRAALDQWDANMAASHIPLFPGEGGPPTPPPRRPETPPSAPPPEGPPGAPPRGATGGPEAELPARPTGTAEEAAAGIAGSSFTGDAARKLGVAGARSTDVEAAANRLAAPDSQFAAQKATVVESPDALLAMRLDARNGQPVNVKVTLVDTLPPTASGEVPVAKYTDLGGGEYLVQVSKGARPEAVERALAHELAEISARHGTIGKPPDDALSPTSRGKITELSPHDEGRLAELRVLGRRLAELAPDSPSYRATLDEAQRLAAHLGLVGEGDAVAARQKLAREALGPGVGRAILDNAIQTALNNPFLQRLTGDFAEDMKLLQRRLEHARSLGEPPGRVLPRAPGESKSRTAWTALEQQIIETIRQIVVREDLVLAGTERRMGGKLSLNRIDALAKTLSPEFMRLVTEGIESATAKLTEKNLPTRPDPEVTDPHTAAATRALFGDQEHFQDWPAFRAKYLAGNPSLDGNDPFVLRRMFEQWAAGSYVAEGTGRARSLLSGMDRPSPGYEHRFLVDPAANESIRLPGDQMITIFSKASGERLASVDDAVSQRAQKLADAATKRAVMNNPQTDSVTRATLKAEIEGIMQGVREISEALGIAAGVAFAKARFGDGEIIIERGSGVPDVLFKRPPDGPLIVIECKGGDSPLGTRLSVDGTVRVEQGTKEYLLSLAAEMARSSDENIRRHGRLLLTQLTGLGKPQTEYYLVRQPIDEAGAAAPEIAQFDTSGKLKPPPQQ